MSVKPCLNCGQATSQKLARSLGYSDAQAVSLCKQCIILTERWLMRLGVDWAFLRGYNNLRVTGARIRLPLIGETDQTSLDRRD